MLGTEKALDDPHWVTLSGGWCQLFCCHRKGHFLGGNTNLTSYLALGAFISMNWLPPHPWKHLQVLVKLDFLRILQAEMGDPSGGGVLAPHLSVHLETPHHTVPSPRTSHPTVRTDLSPKALGVSRVLFHCPLVTWMP